MRIKLFHRLPYLLFLFQIPCFAAFESSLLLHSNFNFGDEDLSKIVVCTDSEQFERETNSPENEMLICGYIREFEPKVVNKIIPDIIMTLCVSFFKRPIPSHYIEEKYRKILSKLDIDEYYQTAINFCVSYKVEDIKDEFDTTILHWVCKKGRIGDARFLLDSGANIEAANKKGWTPLHYACWCGYEGIVELLFDSGDKGANIEAKGNEGETSLYVACCFGNKEIVKLLLEKGANIKVEGKYCETPLHAACWCGHREIAELLLERGANIEAKDKDGQTPLQEACWSGHKEVVQLLLGRGANVEAENNKGETSLHNACRVGHKEIVELLLERGANMEAKNKKGETSLHKACCFGRKEVVKLLLERGANIEETITGYGYTSLIIACAGGRKKVVKLLLERGANIDVKDKIGNTALHYACLHHHLDIVKRLLKNGAKPIEIDDVPLLTFSVQVGSKRLIKVICESKRKDLINQKDKNGFTILHEIAKNGNEKLAEFLIKNGADPHAKKWFGYTPLDIAKKNENKEMIRYLKSFERTSSCLPDVHFCPRAVVSLFTLPLSFLL